jgi:hypothetical protein
MPQKANRNGLENNKGGRLIKSSLKVTSPIAASFFINLAISCSVRKSEPLKKTFIPGTTEIAKGQELYNLHSDKCHRGEKGGLGLGVMPPFKKDEISKDDLKAIGKYMNVFKPGRGNREPPLFKLLSDLRSTFWPTLYQSPIYQTATARYCLTSDPTARPGVLKIKTSCYTVNVKYFSGKKQVRNKPAFHCVCINFA